MTVQSILQLFIPTDNIPSAMIILFNRYALHIHSSFLCILLCCGKLGIHLSGEITDTSTSVNYVFLEVSDTGIGIPPEYQEKIFTPFFRVDKSRSRAMGGAGLGLALVSEIVRQHNGQVKVLESSKKGSMIAIMLPV